MTDDVPHADGCKRAGRRRHVQSVEPSRHRLSLEDYLEMFIYERKLKDRK